MLSVFDHSTPPPCPTPFNLSAYVLGRAGELADKTALDVLGGQTWTYGALETAVRGTGTGLLQHGLRPGDRVLMRLNNTVDFPIAYLGALAVGLVPVPTSPMLTETETRHMIDELGVTLTLRDKTVAGAPGAPEMSVDHLRRMRSLAPCDWHMGDPNRLGYIVYTSGSSGNPRAVAHAHRAIWARRMMFQDWYGLQDDDRLLHAGAFNWTYTLGTGLMDPWTLGATALIPSPGTTANALPALLAQSKATIFAAAPGVYRQLLATSEKLTTPHLRHGLTAGDKASRRIQDAWKTATGTHLYEAYGMSECSTFISAGPDRPADGASLGRPQRGRRVAIVADHDPVPIGQPGLIAVHRDDPGLMLGYWDAQQRQPTRTNASWFITGDRGHMDADGTVTFLGRDDDMMNAGGYRVSPLEVEDTLRTFPGLDQIAVTDVEVKEDTCIIAAFYVARDSVDETELTAYATARLARYKQPRAWIKLPALPTNANGKLLRKALRAHFRTERK